jgi:polysaccharide pyruvyl transferase WcaK-like protein
MSPTVGIIGATIWGNRGAEAMLATAIGQVRERWPGAQVYIFSYLPQRDRALLQAPDVAIIDARPRALVLGHFPGALLGMLRIPDALLPKSARALRRCDVLLDISGISFADGREKFLPFNILNIWPAMLAGTPVVKLAQALGPFGGALTRLTGRLFLARCAHIYARGPQTADFVRALGISADRWDTAPDTAFLYQSQYSLSSENTAQIEALVTRLAEAHANGHTVIGLSPSAVVAGKAPGDYIGQFVRLLAAHAEDDTRFVVLPNATRQGVDATRNNDLPIIAELRARAAEALPAEALARIEWVDYDINTAGSRCLIAGCDLVLTSRFHGMISCLCLKTPVVVVGWSHKYAEVMAAFGLDDFVVDYADPALDLAALVQSLHETRTAVAEKIAAALPGIQAEARAQFDGLARWLNTAGD